MDEYLRLKARSYDIPIAVITTKMHGPEEFMTVIGDILEDPNVRHDYLGKFKDKDEIVQKLRKFYTDSATEVQNMEKEDILRLVDEHRARWKSPGDFVKNRRELGDFR
jgi:hypothetical protein